jgi:hypothetical protein
VQWQPTDFGSVSPGSNPGPAALRKAPLAAHFIFFSPPYNPVDLYRPAKNCGTVSGRCFAPRFYPALRLGLLHQGSANNHSLGALPNLFGRATATLPFRGRSFRSLLRVQMNQNSIRVSSVEMLILIWVLKREVTHKSVGKGMLFRWYKTRSFLSQATTYSPHHPEERLLNLYLPFTVSLICCH